MALEMELWEEEIYNMLYDTMLGVVISRDLEDEWVWKIGNLKVYSVRSAYDFLLENSPIFLSFPRDFVLFKKFWKNCVPRKVLTFSWQLILDRLPTCLNLHHRHVIMDPEHCRCVFCEVHHESTQNLFLLCPFSLQVWY